MEENPYKSPVPFDQQNAPRATRLPMFIVLLAWNGLCLLPVLFLGFAEMHFEAPLGGLLIEVLFYGAPISAMAIGSGILVWLGKKVDRFVARRGDSRTPPAQITRAQKPGS
jgi:hypothetical protein